MPLHKLMANTGKSPMLPPTYPIRVVGDCIDSCIILLSSEDEMNFHISRLDRKGKDALRVAQWSLSFAFS